MTLLLAVIAVSIATGYAVGGRLGRFEQLRLRWWGLAPIGLAMQLAPLPDLQSDGERLLGVGLLIGSYALLLAFVAANARVAGFPLLFVGLALNLIVIAANGGMPVSGPALEASGQTRSLHLLQEGEGEKHHLLGKGDVLTPLADVIAVGRPIGQVVSVGDVVAYGGVIWLVVAVMRGRTRGLVPPPPIPRRGYRGKHRPRPVQAQAARAPLPPAAATRSGTGP